MKKYFSGYSLANDSELAVISKESNRKVIDALHASYPTGLSAQELSENTGLPLKTIYASLAELDRELFVKELNKTPKVRGRPSAQSTNSSDRKSKYIIENISRGYDIRATYPDGNYPLAPGNSHYDDEFIYVWHELIDKKEVSELHFAMLKLVQRVLRVIQQSSSEEIRQWNPPLIQDIVAKTVE